MIEPNINELLNRYKSGECTEEERSWVESWYLKWETKSFDLSEQELISDLQLIKDKLPRPIRQRPYYYRIAAAAIALLTLGTIFYFFQYRNVKVNATQQVFNANATDIVPGGNKAILTLADGKTVVLDNNTKLSEIQQFGVRIDKTAGKLVYIGADEKEQINAFNTITTPKGGQYEISLPDGTKVWLNAASKLRFPIVFARNERNIELSGEAYFEVAKDKTKPFRVKTEQQQITVLGTHFNVNAYGDESFTKTTLLEGKVMVTRGNAKVLLLPGDQSLNDISSPVIKVQKVADVNESIAWKNGLFMFDKEGIFTIMNKISRWYDVEVVYKGDLSGKNYSGNISKFEKVTEVLKTMQLTGTIQFKIEGRRIIVMP